MKSTDSGSNRPRVLRLVGASSAIGRKSPISAQPGNGNFQHDTDIPGHIVNGDFGSSPGL